MTTGKSHSASIFTDYATFLASDVPGKMQEAGGVTLEEHELWNIWVCCTRFANPNTSHSEHSREPLTAEQRAQLLALKSTAEDLIARVEELDPGVSMRLERLFNRGSYNALLARPDLKHVDVWKDLFVVKQIGSIAQVAEEMLTRIPARKRGQRISNDTKSFLLSLQAAHRRAKARLPRSAQAKANFESFVLALSEAMPPNAKHKIPHDVGKLLRRIARAATDK